MSNDIYMLILSPLAIMTLILLVTVAKIRQKNLFAKFCAIFYTLVMCWIVLEIIFVMIDDSSAAIFVFDLKFGFISLAALFAFFAICEFYAVFKQIPGYLRLLICVVPCIIIILSYLSPISSFFLRDNGELLFSIQTLHLFEYSVWYYLHLTYSCLLLTGAAVVILVKLWNSPRAYWNGVIHLFLALIVFFGCTVVKVFKLVDLPLDFILVGTVASCVFLYLATLGRGKTGYLQMEKSEMLHYLDECIFILDYNRRIIDINLTAKNFFFKDQNEPDHIIFEDLLQRLIEDGIIVKKRTMEGLTEDIYILGYTYPLIYSINERPIKNRDGQIVGGFVILNNVTNSRLFMERLREIAGVDPLTKLPNRYRHMELLRETDVTENLPLSVIVGDVNGLKFVNDTFGHAAGDMLLQAVANALLKYSPKNGYAARTGGDEFILLMPNHSVEDAEAVLKTIRKELVESFSISTKPSIAFGIAIKKDASQNINALLNEADKMMYTDKSKDIER